MLIGFVSDPHANLPAIETVLTHVDKVRPDTLVCLGDFVGYGAQPNEVVEALRDRAEICLVGNHDLAALGEIDFSAFNYHAAAAAVWTNENMHASTSDFLRSLTPRRSAHGLLLAHASPRDPIWEYVLDSSVAAANFAEEEFGIAFVGHTHVPAVFSLEEDTLRGRRIIAGPEGRAGIELPVGRLIVNPGGVGQPRDGDPRASWATWDTDSRKFEVFRLEYPIEEAQRAILEAGLPDVLAERLGAGW